MPRPHELPQLTLESLHVLDDHVVHVPLRHRIQDEHLLLDRKRLVLGLLENLDDAAATLELGEGSRVQLGAELGEGRQLAELRQVETQRTGDLPHGVDLGGTTDTGHGLPGVHRRADALEEQVGLQEYLAVRDGDDVRRDVGRDVVSLGLDDGQSCEASRAEIVGQLGAPLQEAAVEVEDVARIGLTPGGTAQQQRDLAVGDGLLRQVVEDHEGVLAVVHPVLADGRPGVRGVHLKSRSSRSWCRDNDRVLHCTGLFQGGHHLGDRRGLLANGDIDTLHGLIGAPETLLVDDRVD